MIYPLIILVSLSVIFIILVRRLPKTSSQEVQPAVLDRPASLANNTNKTIDRTDARKPINWPKFRRPTFTIPKLSLKLPGVRPTKVRPTPDQPVTQARNVRKPNDFWVDREAQKDIPAPPTSSLASQGTIATPSKPQTPSLTKESPELRMAPNRSILRPKKRDQFQEAEDSFAIKDYKKAERLYLKMATEDPRNPKIYGRLGVIYLEQKNFEDARDALIMAIKLEPNIPTRHFNLALTYLQIGSTAKAIASMESSLKYDPSNRKYRKLLDDIIAGKA